MSLQGEIQTMPLQDLFQWLELVHKTGTLIVENNKAKQQFFFTDGEIATATSSTYHSTDTENSVKVILSETMGWEKGKFIFDENHLPPEVSDINLHLSPQQLMLDSLREEDEAAEAERQAGTLPASAHDVGKGFTIAEGLRLAIIDRLLKGEFKVPLLPTVVNKVLEVTRRDNYSLRDLSEVIITDQVITAQLLKHANSAFYNRGNPIDSVPMAVQQLGAQTVTNLVLTLSLQSFTTGRDIFLADKNRIWKHSLACAVLSRSIAPLGKIDREQAFLCGLMIDFGKFVLLSLIHELMKQHKEYQAALKSVVEYIIETYHPKVGGIVGEKWKLPPSVIEAITCHHALVASSEHIRYVAVASLSDAILMEQDDENRAETSDEETRAETIWSKTPAARILKLSEAQIQRIHQLVPECLAYANQMSSK